MSDFEKMPPTPATEGGSEGPKSSVEEVGSILADLEKIGAENERLLNEQVGNREQLIGEAKKIYDSIPVAEDALVDIRFLVDSGDLGEEGRQKLEQAEKIVFNLKDQAAQIEQKISQISSNPKIMGKLREGALAEDKKIGSEKMDREFRERFEREGEDFGNRFCQASLRASELWQSKENSKKEWFDLWNVLRERIAGAGEELGVEPSYIEELKEIVNKADSIDGFISELEGNKNKLGLFDGKKKKLVTRIISYLEQSGLSSQIRKKQENYEKVKASLKTAEEEIDALKEEYKTKVLEAWGAEDRIEEFTGDARMPELPSCFNSSVNKIVKKTAGIKRFDSKTGKEVGRYDGWFETEQSDPKVRALSRRWEELSRSASAYVDFRKEKEE